MMITEPSDCLTIDPCTLCQLRCPGCPNTGRGNPPPGQLGSPHHKGWGFLKEDDFLALINLNPFVRRIIFSCFGEVFLNPHLYRILRHCNERGITVNLGSVNFNRVSDEALEGLVKFGVSSLTCAIDGATAETYRMYRLGGDFDRVINNIKRLNYWKEQYESSTPELTWLYVVFGHNEHEIAQARAKAEELGMRFQGKLAWDSDFSPIRNPVNVAKELGWDHTTREEYQKANKRHSSTGECFAMWRSPFINWDGRMFGCCWNARQSYGNVFEDGYMQTLNNEKMCYARDMLMGKASPRDDIACTQCAVYKVMQKNNTYITRQEVRQYIRHNVLYHAMRFVYHLSGMGRIWRAVRPKVFAQKRSSGDSVP